MQPLPHLLPSLPLPLSLLLELQGEGGQLLLLLLLQLLLLSGSRRGSPVGDYHPASCAPLLTLGCLLLERCLQTAATAAGGQSSGWCRRARHLLMVLMLIARCGHLLPLRLPCWLWLCALQLLLCGLQHHAAVLPCVKQLLLQLQLVLLLPAHPTPE